MGATRADFKTLVSSLETRRVLVEDALRRLWTPGESAQIESAVEDSLMAPAKRLRPILGLLVAEIFRTDPATILPAACAVEMVHTSSLILDDLPSMDDAQMRRGRPACHVIHGESTAILAAFALQNRAFEILAEGWAGGPDAPTRSLFAADLSRAIGVRGMIAGQVVDLSSTGVDLDFATLEFIHSRKTGALFLCSASLGTTLRASIAERQAVATYAKNLGLAFQVIDDLLDASGHASATGKDGGQDERKTTFVSFAGVDGARTLADDLAQTARAAIEGLGPRAQPLRDLSHYVVARDR
jgi:geranylgeranyl diphosphate synthase, type II